VQPSPAGGPPAVTDSGLPAPPELVERLLAGRDDAVRPAGGDAALRGAAVGYWERRAVKTTPEHVLLAPGPGALMLGLLATVGGELLVPRPAAPWYAPPAWLLGRRVRTVPTPAECGGVPDPVALLESLRRADDARPGPTLLALAVADDPTGTVAPAELVHEVCEAAAEADLIVVSDESFRDLPHDPHTVVLSPAEIVPDRTVVISDLASWLLPGGWPAAMARFPALGPAAELRAPVRTVLDAQRALLPGPVGAAAGLALAEPPGSAERLTAAVRLHAAVAAAAHRELLRCGALALPPAAGFHLYADFTARRPALAVAGVGGPDALAARLPGALAGHRMGEDPRELRVRIAVPALYGHTPAERAAALADHVAAALADLGRIAADLTAG
jgi:aspartate aminotransferase